MLKEFDIEDGEIIPVCVMATMSSGKSTFLNAVFGEEILPEKNEACTARALSVMNVPGVTEAKAYIRGQNGKRGMVDLFYPDTVAKINGDETVESVLIVREIESIQNTDKSIVFIDTPGVNNSEDIRHGERTHEILDKLKKGVIVYLLNATQLAANDDELLLRMVVDHVKRNPDVRILFVLNKIDMLDEDRESIPGIIDAARQYIGEHGLEDINIFPLSALSAKTFRMKLNGKNMTRAEQRHLEQAYPEYRTTDKSMLRYVDAYHRRNDGYTVGGETVSEYELRRAVENTGIVEIERQTGRFVGSFGQARPQKLEQLKDYPELEGIYARRRRTRNHVNYHGKAMWICRQCRQVNGENEECLNCKKPNVRWYRME